MRITRLRLVWSLMLVPVLLFGRSAGALWQQTAKPDTLLAVADEIVPVVARIRGLEPKAAIKKGVESREQISRALNELVSDQYEKTELKRGGVVLKKLGLIPVDMDFADFTIKLLTEQIGGYYDPEKKTFFLAGWLSADQQKPVMAHELTHALQDQYFDLDAMMKRDRKSHNDDMTLAHQALVEGDATGVMLDYLLEPLGRSFVQLPDLAFIMRAQMSLMDSQFVVLKSAPEYIKESLLFPYGYGAAFLQKVRSGNAPWPVVNKVYADMPSSTEQIMHPEKYLGQRDNPKAVAVEDPTPQLGKDWKIVYRNVLGEFSLYLLLKLNQPDQTAMNASSGWGGDQVILVEEDGRDRSAVFAESTWDDQDSADRFYAAASNWLERRFPQGRKEDASDSGFAMVAGSEYHSIQRRGTGVYLVLGLPESLAGKLTWPRK